MSGGPLTGLRVLELGHIVAGPTAALILADLGAEVIKVERPGSGDQARVSVGNQGHFTAYNTNKRSIELDLRGEHGRSAFRRLISHCDILVDNYAPGALDRAGFGYDELAAINPRLIQISIKGFLPGPNENRPLTDEPAQMMGGLAYMTGPRGRPLRAGTSVVDITGAMFGLIGALAALREREQTGKGRYIRVGLFETVAFLVGQHIAKAGLTGEVPVPMPERSMGKDLGWGIYRIFRTRDDRDVFVAVLSNPHWQAYCKEFGLDDLWAEPELRSNAGRTLNYDRLTARTERVVGEMTFDEAIERFERAGIPFAPVHTPMDLVTHPQLLAGGFLKEVHAPDGRSSRVPGMPFTTPDWFRAVRSDPPVLGEHSIAVLQEIGYAEEEIEAVLAEARAAAEAAELKAKA